MSEIKHTPGPWAFPVPEVTVDGNCYPVDHAGMTLRDYFAAKALSGMCADGQQTHRGDDVIATDAYSLADAMLRARGQS